MYVFLLSIGVIATAIGVFTIGFGAPIYEFSLGNTLIIAGTMALAGGLVLIGLAAAVRQLRRIADALPARPVAARAVRASEPVEQSSPRSSRGAPGARIPFPPRTGAESSGGEQRPFEQRLTGSSTETSAPEETPSERQRPNIFTATRPPKDGSFATEQESVPLAPTRIPAPSAGRTAPASEPTHEPKFAPLDTLPRVAGSGRGVERKEAPSSERLTEPASERRPVSSFDMAWPAEPRTTKPVEPRPGRPAGHEIVARAPKPEVQSEPKPETRDRDEPVPPMPAREEVTPSSRVPDEPRPVSILKSGVIDGMAYTLYTDGSIEAQLPQGTVHFGSIEELRIHLEHNG